MPQFAANLSMLYPELPFLDRFEAAARDGFQSVEYLFPYEWSAQELATRLKDNGLQQVLFNAPPGGSDAPSIAQAWDNQMRGMACLPEHRETFKRAFDLALSYAQTLNCPRVHVMAGLVPEAHRSQQPDPRPVRLRTSHRAFETATVLRETYVSNLAWAAEQAAAVGVDVLIEPINTRDIPHFFINRQEDAHAVVRAVGASNLKVQFDLYHCQIVEGDVSMALRDYLPTGQVGHLQIAGIPDRHEPHEGELAYAPLFDLIDELTPAGGPALWLGCEYRPRGGSQPGATSAGLRAWAPWLKR